jgi:hypothetical protein
VIIRLITFQAVNWTVTSCIAARFGPDQPIWTWVAVSCILALSNAVQWVFQHKPSHQKITDPDHARPVSFSPRKDIIIHLIIPLTIASIITTVALLEKEAILRHDSYVAEAAYRFSTNLEFKEIRPFTRVRVLMIVLTSWSDESFQKRQIFRESTAKLIPQYSNDISVVYRFILGSPTSTKRGVEMLEVVKTEAKFYKDLIIVPADDNYDKLSQKVYKGLEWANGLSFDYLVKTDDDMFVRIDTVSKELEDLGPGRKYYWRGLGYW